jgi:hypothetical protein
MNFDTSKPFAGTVAQTFFLVFLKDYRGLQSGGLGMHAEIGQWGAQ